MAAGTADASSSSAGTTGVDVKEAMTEAASEAAGGIGTETADNADSDAGETKEASGHQSTDAKRDTENSDKANELQQERARDSYTSVSKSFGQSVVHGAADTPLDTKLFYTLRALEDEGVTFLRSKQAKKLPERNTDIIRRTAK